MIPDAMELLHRTIDECGGNLFMAAISGPGDPLASPDITLQIIDQIHSQYPDLKIGLKTLGLGSSKIAKDLAEAGANHVELMIDGVKAEIVEKIYAWIRPGQKTLKISKAAELLVAEQRHGLSALKFAELGVHVQTTVYPGYNDNHILKIAKEIVELGADSMSLIPYCSAPGAEVELDSPSEDDIASLTAAVEEQLPVTEPLLIQKFDDIAKPGKGRMLSVAKPSKEKPNVAVVSSDGIDVNLHLGQAPRFLIYGPREDGLTCLLEARNAPDPGGNRWQEVASLLSDCFVLLVESAGETPRKTLSGEGLQVVMTEENIEGLVEVLYGLDKKGKGKGK